MKIGIIGAGNIGTAIGKLLTARGHCRGNREFSALKSGSTASILAVVRRAVLVRCCKGERTTSDKYPTYANLGRYVATEGHGFVSSAE